MLYEIGYNRREAVRYAVRWAYARNPDYYDFENIGGDCTNYVSQCLYAGCGVMNYNQQNPWYYADIDNRSPSWTGVEFLHRFLLSNKGAGVYGADVSLSRLSAGDVVMLKDGEGRLYHSVIVSYILQPATPRSIFVCSHSYDRRNAPLSVYDSRNAVGIHILGARAVG